MRTPLLAALLCLSLGASAAPKKSSDEADFDKRFAAAVKKASQAFLDGEPLPKLELASTITTQLKTSSYLENYATLVAQASYVQAGRAPEDDEATYRAMVAHVAEKLLVPVDKALERYGKVKRDPSKVHDPLAEPALRAGLLTEMMMAHQLPPDAEKQMKAKLDGARKALEALGGGADVDVMIGNASSRYYRDPTNIEDGGPGDTPYWWKKLAVPGLDVTSPPSSGGFLGWLDNTFVGKIVREIKENVVGFIGYCYRYVAKALDVVLPAGWRKDVKLASAYQFATSLNSNPKLFDKLKLRKMDVSEIVDGVPPVGAIVVFHKGVCGFSAEHGHIEIVTRNAPQPQACSDGCMTFNENRKRCLKEKGPLGLVNVYVPVRSDAPTVQPTSF